MKINDYLLSWLGLFMCLVFKSYNQVIIQLYFSTSCLPILLKLESIKCSISKKGGFGNKEIVSYNTQKNNYEFTAIKILKNFELLVCN